MTTIRINETELDTNEEWIVRNALTCYRRAVVECAISERDQAESFRSQGKVSFAETCERLADEWDRTTERIEALEEKLG